MLTGLTRRRESERTLFLTPVQEQKEGWVHDEMVGGGEMLMELILKCVGRLLTIIGISLETLDIC